MGSNTTTSKSLRVSTAPNRKKWPARLAATPLLTRWPTPAKEELPVVTRPAAVPRGHVGPAPVVEETRHAVKGLADEKSAKHDKTQQSSKDLCMCRLYISNLNLWLVHFM